MTADLIDGKAFAAGVRARVTEGVSRFRRDHGRAPGLSVILVGDDPASEVYVRNKARTAEQCGIRGELIRLEASTTQAQLLARIEQLNRDPAVDGILVQLPLPAQIDPHAVLSALDPAKDVDGFHPVNVGRLHTGLETMVPCTPWGSMLLIRDRLDSLAGKAAVVIGRSTIVGRPMAALLTAADATVTLAHSRTRDLGAVAAAADILVVAVGRPEMVRADWVKPGAIVIDVGINRVTGAEGTARLVGDVAFEEVRAVAGAITPVPGGVGPMTIASLMEATLTAATRRMAARDARAVAS